jgi:hypothetical protein
MPGKSTLFNTLTRATVLAEDLLFATLDPTMREIQVPGFDKAILSDTVGFVSNLPTELVAAFRATLEEVASADLILHVRDIHHPDSDAQKADVEQVLSDLDIGEGEEGPARLELWNKVDLLEGEDREALLNEAARREDVVALSAVTGEGLDALLTRSARRSARAPPSTTSALPPATAADSPGSTAAGRCSTAGWRATRCSWRCGSVRRIGNGGRHSDMTIDLPPALSEWSDSPRCRPLNDQPFREHGRYILCWLQQALRSHDNPAIDAAIRLGNALGKPVLVYHGLREDYPFASARLHRFILGASRDVAAGAVSGG